MLATGRTAQTAATAAHQLGLGVGVHLCVTTQLPPASHPEAVRWLAPGGFFRRTWADFAGAWLSGLVPREEVEAELRAQVDRVKAWGVPVDHLDMHQHLHVLPRFADVVGALARDLRLPLRWPKDRPSRAWNLSAGRAAKALLLRGLSKVTAPSGVHLVRAIGVFDSGGLDEARLLALLDRLPEGDLELMAHPGLHPGTVPEDPAWSYGWELELEALTSPRVADKVKARSVALCRYSDLT